MGDKGAVPTWEWAGICHRISVGMKKKLEKPELSASVVTS